jgi:ABC-type transport system involved in cytochrome c biogenesis permease subunit
MATSSLTDAKQNLAHTASAEALDFKRLFWKTLHLAGSLKITVTMFALSMLILLIGTLAQDEQSIVDVKYDYFNSWIAVVPLDVFAPQTLLPHAPEDRIPYAFLMPGGALVGLILMINLFAAKLTRFAMSARGSRLALGLFVTAIGTALMSFVIITAHTGDGVQGDLPIAYDSFWTLFKVTIWAATLAAIVWAGPLRPKHKLLRYVAISTVSVMMLWSLGLVFFETYIRVPDPGLRIVWQLGRGLVVGLILLSGMSILFGKRGGNVLIHVAVAMLMVGQFVFGDRQIEERMTIAEGQSTNETYQIDSPELAIIDRSNAAADKVVAIDIEKLTGSDDYVTHDALPIEIKMLDYYRNSDLARLTPNDPNVATAGIGLTLKAIDRPPNGGASEQTDLASAYISIRNKTDGAELGTYLVSQLLQDDQVARRSQPETIAVDGQPYDLALRWQRRYTPYQVQLKDVQRIDYSGTAKPQDFSSQIAIKTNDGEEVQSGKVWMNNPLRYEGQTFYQSGYASAERSGQGVEVTTLQVVKNAGWLVPYMACVLAGIGMLSHFGLTFSRFAGRYERAEKKVTGLRFSLVTRGLTAACGLGFVALLFAYAASPAKNNEASFNYTTAGQIPVRYNGRITPLDSAARHVTLTLRGRQTALDVSGESIPATKFLLATMADEEWILDARNIKIDAKNVLDLLELERRQNNTQDSDKEREFDYKTRNLYSYNDIKPRLDALREHVRGLPEDSKKWKSDDNKIVQTDSKIRTLESILMAYRPLPLPRGEEEMRQTAGLVRYVTNANIPAVIPPLNEGEMADGSDALIDKWTPFAPAGLLAMASQEDDGLNHDRTRKFAEIINDYREDRPTEFNASVEKFTSLVAEHPTVGDSVEKVKFEAWYEGTQLVNVATFLYVGIFSLVMLSYLGSITPTTETIGRTVRSFAFWLAVGTLCLHTAVIVFRIVISERPPVVNLYSSAVFIGWAMVLAGLIIESLYPLGLGTLVGSITGFLTLLVAHGLNDGDTMPVLQAVLDTQFWLTTHVVCVTLGYAATFVAGFIGICLLAWMSIQNLFPSIRETKVTDIIYRLCYGVICFALFFSFVGTVLGGLWGDDSWGRFWGWDPKENGALMIVLWNALLLHARWDKMVGARGFALLAIAGNVVTAWSYFGTNQLGIGLHSYGFTEASLRNLILFIGVQFAIMLVGFLLTIGFKSKPAETAWEK